jgi:dihydrodipicolinate synthase/N-acetylneuraminate lyase
LTSFEGVHPVLQIPFAADADQAIRHDELACLVQTLVDDGVSGLVVLGLASEAWTLTPSERDSACATAASVLDSRLPFTVGLAGDKAVVINQAVRAASIGASAVMVLPPADVPPTHLPTHFASVADAADIPVLIQDSPQVTGVQLSISTIAGIMQSHPLICAVKIEAPDAGQKISEAVASGINVVAGWGGLHYPDRLRRGAVGCMPGSDLGAAFSSIHRLWRQLDEVASDSIYRAILPLLSYLSQSLELLILGAKHALVRRAIFTDASMRAPARSLDRVELKTLNGLHAELEHRGLLPRGSAAAMSPKRTPKRTLSSIEPTDVQPGN